MSYNFQGFEWYGPEVMANARKSVAAGVAAGAIFLADRVKETLSVAAPRRRVLGKRGGKAGVYYYVASVPATAGAPPRKLSGRLRSTITQEVNGLTARVGTNIKYARRLETQGHQFLLKTAELVRSELGIVIGSNAVRGS